MPRNIPADRVSRVDAELTLIATKRRLLVADDPTPTLLDQWRHLETEIDDLLDRRLDLVSRG